MLFLGNTLPYYWQHKYVGLPEKGGGSFLLLHVASYLY